MASQSQGIQQLLHAEKRAAEKVADARKSESSVLYLGPRNTNLSKIKQMSESLGKLKAGGVLRQGD